MKYWHRLTGNEGSGVNEHDMPTEPVPYPDPAREPGYAQGPYEPAFDPSPYEERTVAAPPPSAGRPLFSPEWQQPPQQQAWNPPAYAAPVPRPQPERYRSPESGFEEGRRRGTSGSLKLLPGFIAIFFVIVQLSLFARFVMRFILHTPDDQQWVAALYAFSTIFLVPVEWLASQIHLPFTLDPELYALPAILLYAILARIVVSMTRFIVRSFS